MGGAVVAALSLFAYTVAPTQAADLNISVSGTDGVGRITTPGRPCDEGGDGAHWHYDYGSQMDRGVFSSLASELRLHLDLHSEDDATRIDPGADPPFEDTGAGAFLQGEESHASLINDRGTIKLRLSSGDCDEPTLDFDGTTASGAGDWVVDRGVGSYRGATGSGEFTLPEVSVAPGADNPFELVLDGDFEILLPGLEVEVVQTYWGFLGADYLLRQPTVVFRISNVGPGDSFHSKLVDVTTPTSGVKVLGPKTAFLGDLHEGDSELVSVKFQLGLLQPCALVILGCEFDATLHVSMPDALDRPDTQTDTAHARAPDLPPPL
jgi:hypothetical protein